MRSTLRVSSGISVFETKFLLGPNYSFRFFPDLDANPNIAATYTCIASILSIDQWVNLGGLQGERGRVASPTLYEWLNMCAYLPRSAAHD